MQDKLEAKSRELLTKQVSIKYTFPEDLKTQFVSNLVIQHEPGIFMLSFFETLPPIILGETEEEKHMVLEKIEFLESKCLARLIITPEKMEAFIKAMSENFNAYKNTFLATKKSD
jgi:hypothetical protein